MLIVRLLSILRRATTGALILVCALVSRSDLQDLTVHQTDCESVPVTATRPQQKALLSSCETSLGNATDGTGIRGLTSAFLLGGAGAVVGSLWPVESASTMQLMSGAFDSLIRQRKSPAESLRAAQIALIQNPATRHPYYWSGFAVTGNGSAIRP